MKILDCTLRDGGYYTKWDFDANLVEVYFESFNQLPVEYLEIGYRSQALPNYLGEFFYVPINTLERLRQFSNKKLAVILNEKDVRAKEAPALLEPCKDYIDMVRLAIDPANFERAIDLGHAVKKMGFELCFNVMYMSNWLDFPELMSNVKNLEGLADYLYMVDSFGGVYPKDIIRTMQSIRERTSIPLGFHGHNNLELALINTLTAIDQGIDIVDATITGMGRGAGNLKMELLLTVLNAKNLLNFEYNALSKVVDTFSELKQKYKWGTNLPYMVSGAYSMPQKEVMEWVSKRFYSYNSIIRALDNQSKGMKDNQKLEKLDFSQEHQYEIVMIVGGGPSVLNHHEAIQKFLDLYKNIVIVHASSKNASHFQKVQNDQYFCLIGNEGHRLEDVFLGDITVNGKCILPPFPRKMGTYIPKRMENSAYELEKVDFSDQYLDSHTAIALQTALELGVKKIFFIGYDGYSGSSISQREQELFLENEYLFEQALQNGLQCISLTKTKYNNIKHESIFAYI